MVSLGKENVCLGVSKFLQNWFAKMRPFTVLGGSYVLLLPVDVGAADF